MSVNTNEQIWHCNDCNTGGTIIDWMMLESGQSAGDVLKNLSGTKGTPRRTPKMPVVESEPDVPPWDECVPEKPTTGQPERKEVASYRYTDALGSLLYEVVRFEPKDFRQRHMKNGQWVWSMNGVERVLYNLPALLTANVSHVWVVEGEKDADMLKTVGIVATTNVGGAGKWMDSYSESLRGKEVILCGDNDDAGRKHVEKVLAALSDKAKSIRCVSIPSPHKDVSDFIAAQPNRDAAFTALVKLCEVATVLTGGIVLPIKSMRELEAEYREHVANATKNTLDLGKWLPSMRRYVRGLVAGELIAILGATAVGKTAILQNIALHSYPLHTLFFEMELPGSLTFERFIQISQGMGGEQVHNRFKGNGDPLAWDTDVRLENIHVCTKSRITPEELETIINKSEAKIGARPALVVIDYAQLVHGRGNTRYERASDVSERLKVIAKETGTVVVFGSQVQRKAKDESNEVFLHDGKESGSIENSSGLVLGAWRDADEDGLLKLKILKNTKGRPGAIIDCNFDGATLRITERSPVHDYVQ